MDGAFTEVAVDEGVIADVRKTEPHSEAPSFLAPGFIDIQINGFAGVDFNHAQLTGENLLHACRALLKTGVTCFCPTLITNEPRHIARGIVQIADACDKHRLVRAMILGIHLEGPFIAAEDGPRGAHPSRYVSDPDWDAFLSWHRVSRGLLRMVTVAPERPGALDFIRRAKTLGMVVAIGHCAPDPDQIDAAVLAGVTLSTHLGNAAHAALPRHANYVQKQMAHDGLMASVICDGHHLPAYFVKNLARAKGRSRVILISDAIAGAAAPAGSYTLGELDIDVGEDRCAHLSGTPYLAGSTLTMDAAIENCMHFTGLGLKSVLPMATSNPARLFGGSFGRLRKGQRADLVLFGTSEDRINIHEVVLAGRSVYRT
jgi:N-acetylglucosamine-6-phosphate deacetylase